jgi:hypothetical protein
MSKLIVKHNAGFFSCTSIRLYDIISYYNLNKKLPDTVDYSEQYNLYRDIENEDLSSFFFNINDDIKIEIFENKLISNNKNIDPQVLPYCSINFKNIKIFIDKYFNLSIYIKNIVDNIIHKYKFDSTNSIGVFYRGNDKITETSLGSYSTFYNKMVDEYNKDNNKFIFLQTDDQCFVDYCVENFKDKEKLIIFNEVKRISNDPKVLVCNTIDIGNRKNNISNYLAITYILSKSNILITHSGNGALWCLLFRGNSKNTHQYLNNNWI